MIRVLFFIFFSFQVMAIAQSGNLQSAVENLKQVYIDVFADGELLDHEKPLFVRSLKAVRSYLNDFQNHQNAQQASSIIQRAINDLSTYQHPNPNQERSIQSNVGYLVAQLFPKSTFQISADEIHTEHPNLTLRNQMAQTLGMGSQDRDELLNAINDSLLTPAEMRQIPSLVLRIQKNGTEEMEDELLVEKVKSVSDVIYNFLEKSTKKRIERMISPLVSKRIMSQSVADQYLDLSYLDLIVLEKNSLVPGYFW